ncbi:MAG: Nucleolar protein 10 [Watsoniomyces obsoletus]|nr:MAG: Nucleolar protein 10 [Watsoniomyces obsoletus]
MPVGLPLEEFISRGFKRETALKDECYWIRVLEMRPNLSGEGALTPARKAEDDGATSTSRPHPGSSAPMTYFLADQRTMEASTLESGSAPATELASGSSTYGVHSLAETVAEATMTSKDERQKLDEGDANPRGAQDGRSPDRALVLPARAQPLHPRISELQFASSDATSKSSNPPFPQPTANSPLTPLLLASPATGLSLPSSPRSTSSKSLRQDDSDSMVDDVASQAIVSSEDDEMDMPVDASQSAPQLIMPSIKMPSRRPFTERGKSMGRLKILIAGGCGVGKTSLIKSIVQACEDIVHVDPLSANVSSVSVPSSRKASTRASNWAQSSTHAIAEVFASTRPYPMWWSELDDSRVLKRRKSLGDSVLERNLCFVDTPGYRKDSSSRQAIDQIVHYVESQLQRATSTDHMTDEELTNLLGGNGSPHVDLVFLMFSQKLRPSDLELMRRLSPLTNVIPLIAKADLLTADQTTALKSSVAQKLRASDLQPFRFRPAAGEAQWSDGDASPFAVSSAIASDADNMDASLLMSADYVQPLVSSELSSLIARTLEPDSISWLRHSAARKAALWRHRSPTSQQSAGPAFRSPMSLASSTYAGLAASTSSTGPSASSPLGISSLGSSQVLVSPMGATSSYALARIADHQQREEKLAQVRLAKWASDLQRSLQHERERFEALARGERAVWLAQRLGECVVDGTLVPASDHLSLALSRPGTRRTSAGVSPEPSLPMDGKGWAMDDPRDPLGLLRYRDDLRQRAWLALQVVGGLGIIGGLAMWIARNWDMMAGDRPPWHWS